MDVRRRGRCSEKTNVNKEKIQAMKARVNKIVAPDPPFQPFDLVLTIESEEEAVRLYQVFNWVPTARWLDAVDLCAPIRVAMREGLGNRELVGSAADLAQFVKARL